jgi:2-polyprenyl-3-methyl-5-hydroxy-6-metoxy-1,4-benzoquinol methylase
MPPAEALASLAVLGTFCTALAFVLFTALVGEVGPGRATVITYVAPLVALALGAVALHERPGAGGIVGLILIVAGSSLATRAPRSPDRETIEYYERTARQYATEISPTPPVPRADALRRLVACLPSGASVLEVGSGTGRDADYMETLGAHVRRTDVARAFIDLQAERGKQAELLDLLTDELGGRYHAVLAMCVLIHVDRARADAVLHKVAAALLPNGAFLVSVREGASEQADARHITYWRRDEFAARLTEAGLHVEWDSRDVDSADETWLTFLARRSTR